MDSPLVAVVMPAYNAERTIGAAIDSVRAQTYPNWFLSICDDGSFDSTRQTAIEAIPCYWKDGKQLAAFKTHDHSNGPSAARNTAYSRIPAAATHVLYLDADDTLTPDALETMLARLSESSLAGAVVMDAANMDADGNLLPAGMGGKYGAVSGEGKLQAGQLLGFDYIIDGDVGFFPPSRIIFHRWVVDAAGLWDAAIEFAEDHDLFCRVALHAPFVYHPGVVTHYRNHAGNTTDRTSREDRTQAWRYGKHGDEGGAGGLATGGYRKAWAARGRRYRNA